MAFNIAIIGFVAGILTTASFIPQLIKSWKTKSTADVSMQMFILTVIGIASWLVYGILLGDLPLILATTVSLIISGAILGLKIKYG